MDNGSPQPLNIDSLQFASPCPVQLIYVSPREALQSPASCINAAVRNYATGDCIMICIDGARLGSSHLVRRSVDVLSRHPDAFTFVGSRHLGSKSQMQSVREGYNQVVEDELIGSVSWELDLDSLYSISVWAGAHERTNPLMQNESNAFAMTRTMWNMLGGYDEGFTRPGGGLCNLELFERCVTPDNSLNVLLFGETTFHQIHGGAATSHDGYFKDSLAEYFAVTGKTYQRPVFSFLADLGERYQRVEAVGEYLTCGR